MNINELKAERERLLKRLEWLGLRSTGSERIERRIAAIDAQIKAYEEGVVQSIHQRQ